MLVMTLALAIAALYFAQAVLIPVAVAILLTFILTPAVGFFQHHGVKRVFAVLLVLVLTFVFLGAVLWIVTLQIHDLSQEMANHSKQISRKVAALRAGEPGMVSNFLRVFQDIGDEIDRATGGNKLRKGEEPLLVEDVNRKLPGGLGLLPVIVRPVLEVLASVGLVLMLVTFMLISREDLRNRLIRLVGHVQLMETTRALDEAASRISKYLLSQLAVNTCFGLILGIGLFFIGAPYAFLWGFLAVIMRFVPYIGIWLSGLLPLTISIAVAPTWVQPLMVAVLYLTMELITSNVIEPLVLSHSTGISITALLVSAAFWTFLWGPIGLVLSAPLSVCLAVLGRYVPHLVFLNILLGDEPVLETKVRLYQRLVAQDQDEAIDLVEAYLTDHSSETLHDDLLMPAVLYAKRDRESHGMTVEDEHFVLETIRGILKEVCPPQCKLEEGNGMILGPPKVTRVVVLGAPARNSSDEVALEMLGCLLRAKECSLDVLSARLSTDEVISHLAECEPALFVIASLPPGGLSQATSLCKRLRSRSADMKIAVGRWGHSENVEQMQDRLRSAGADFIATTLLGSREQVLAIVERNADASIRQIPNPVPAQPR
jgi:predicted PurR-regulated permease PerM